MYGIQSSPDRYLASRFGVTVKAAGDALGSGWQAVDLGERSRDWFVAGEPEQVMLGVGLVDVCVTTPQVSFARRPIVVPADTTDVVGLGDIEALRPVVEAAERRRRAEFAFCRHCRRLFGPEHLLGPDRCTDCGAKFFRGDYRRETDLPHLLGVSDRDLHEQLGGPWTIAQQDTFSRWNEWTWFVAGSPAQVLIGWGFDEVVVAVPEIVWHGHRPAIAPAQIVRSFQGSSAPSCAQLRPAVDEAERLRRTQFVWCRSCRRLQDPAHMLTADHCQGCASKHLGITF